jgi:plastocyanin
MRRSIRYPILLALLAGLAAPAGANPPRKVTQPTMADIDRLEKKIEEHQRTIDRLVKLHQLLMQAFGDTPDGTASKPPAVEPPAPPAPAIAEKPAPPKPAVEAPVKKVAVVAKPPPKKEEPKLGTIVGRVDGVSDAIVYIEDIVQPVRASAAMKQEGKQFLPPVLVVTKGTTVAFPNRDAIFHNVFSPSPDNSFDLGSYKQGESRSVTMNQSGVVTVYCNMHPQMVGHILVVPNGKYVRTGKDGFFRLADVPPGPHRVVAWAPNAKPSVVSTTVSPDQVATIEMTVTKRHTAQHVKKDGLPYGSYEK